MFVCHHSRTLKVVFLSESMTKNCIYTEGSGSDKEKRSYGPLYHCIKMSEIENMEVDSEEVGSATVESSQSKKTSPKKFEIKKWTAVAFWSWDIAVDNCAICRNHIMEPCIECQPMAMTDTDNECVAAWGTCNHAFHLHCINKWIKTRDACPLDNQPWQLARCGR